MGDSEMRIRNCLLLPALKRVSWFLHPFVLRISFDFRNREALIESNHFEQSLEATIRQPERGEGAIADCTASVPPLPLFPEFFVKNCATSNDRNLPFSSFFASVTRLMVPPNSYREREKQGNALFPVTSKWS
jgi:hypothetical protein